MTSKYSVYPDGNAWCAVGDGFKNLQESEAGFGASPCDALTDLIKNENTIEINRCTGMRQWKCTACSTVFSRGLVPKGQVPGCIYCTGGGQYVYEITQEPT